MWRIVIPLFFLLSSCSSPFQYGISDDSTDQNTALIVEHPQSQAVAPGMTVQFRCRESALASGAVSYQWQRKRPADYVWSSTGNDNSEHFFIAVQSDSGSIFRCIVTAGFERDTSRTATLIVSSSPLLPAFARDLPADTAVGDGDRVTLSVAVLGSDLTYQWERYDSYWKTVSEQGSTYTFTADRSLDGKEYRCVVSGTAGSITSRVLTLSVKNRALATKKITLFNAYSKGSSAANLSSGLTIAGSVDPITGELTYSAGMQSLIDVKTVNSVGRGTNLQHKLVALNGTRFMPITSSEFESPNTSQLQRLADGAGSPELTATYGVAKLAGGGYAILKTQYDNPVETGNVGSVTIEYALWE